MTNLVEKEFSKYLRTLKDQSIGGLLREAIFALPEEKRRELIIKHLPEFKDTAVHESHCSEDTCKYGEEDCPVTIK